MDERLQRTVEVLREIGADWVILSTPESIAYALGYAPPLDWAPSPFAAGPNLGVVGSDGAVGLLALEGEIGTTYEGVAVFRYDGYGHLPKHPPDGLYLETLELLLKRLGVSGAVAVEPGTLPALANTMLPSTRKDGFASVFRRQRMTKTAAEIAALRHAAEVTAAGQRQFQESLRAGVTELHLFSEIRSAMESAAGERLAVAGDLVSGRARTAAAGGRPIGRLIARGDAVLSDLAPRVGAYWGDSCATTVVGAASEKQMQLFQAAHAALKLAVAELRPAITAEAAHRLIHGSVRRAGFDYRHHTGHGIGTAVHEHPRIAEGEVELLRPDMVLMIEPGAYNPEIGGARTEWMLRITEAGCEPLSPFPLVGSVDR